MLKAVLVCAIGVCLIVTVNGGRDRASKKDSDTADSLDNGVNDEEVEKTESKKDKSSEEESSVNETRKTSKGSEDENSKGGVLQTDTGLEDFDDANSSDDVTDQEEIKTPETDEIENMTCGSFLEIEEAKSPDLDGEVHALGTVAKYYCRIGYVSRIPGGFPSVCEINETSGKAEWTQPVIACSPRSCGNPGYVENARRVGNLFTFPNKIEFVCDEGYKLRGVKSRYCEPDGHWSGRLPTCEVINCTTPTDLENGRVSFSSLEYGSELRYECNPGFVLQNHETRVCSADGKWSNNEPECIEARCDSPPSPSRGSVHLSGEPTVGTLAVYSCDEGTTLVGSSKSRCSENGIWLFDAPKCLRSCKIPEIENGDIGRFKIIKRYRQNIQEFEKFQMGEAVKHGKSVVLTCNHGFTPASQSTVPDGDKNEVSCDDGEWSKPLECKALLCLGDPPPIENGIPVVEDNYHGKVIRYRCTDGFTKLKPGAVVCDSGTWKGNTPVCGYSPCHTKELNFPGLITPVPGYFEESLEIRCEEGYEKTTSNNIISCLKGKWEIESNPCTISRCHTNDLNYPGLKITDSGYYFKERSLEIKCEEGYEKATSNNIISCLKGKWEIESNPCRKSRCHTNDLNYSGLKITDPGYYFEERSLEIRCEEGYEKTALNNIISCLKGKWEIESNPCTITRCHTDQLNYPGLEISETRYFASQRSFKIRCKKGYKKTVLLNNIKCLKGKWEIESNPCTIETDSSDDRSSDEESSTTGNRNTSNASEDDNSAVHETNEIENLTCGNLPEIEEATRPDLEGEVHALGTVAKYHCKIGYVSRIPGGFTSVCEVNETSGKAEWTQPVILCSARSCTDPGYVTNARRVGNLFTFPNKIEFVCHEGYKLKGVKSRYCEASGRWNGTLPSCEVINCTAPTDPVNGRVYFSSLEYGSELKYECNPGFVLQNHKTRVCSGDEKWSNNEPECIGSCKIPEIRNGSAGRLKTLNQNKQSYEVGEAVKLDESVVLRCNEGFRPASRFTSVSDGGTDIVSCKDGKWSKPLECKALLCLEKPPPTENGTPMVKNNIHGSVIWYECHHGFKKLKRGHVQCEYGTWKGNTPVCGVEERQYPRETSPDQEITPLEVNNHKTTEIPISSPSPAPPDTCYCSYDYPTDMVAAYVGSRPLDAKGRMKKGDTVTLSCLHPGTYLRWTNGLHFYLTVNLTCNTCENWTLRDLPSCEPQMAADSYLLFSNDMKIRPGGILEIPKWKRVSFQCINLYGQAAWNPRYNLGTHFVGENHRTTNYFSEYLIIDSAVDRNAGRYDCYYSTQHQMYRPVTLDLKIVEAEIQCPILETRGVFNIRYENDRKVHSVAHYACKSSTEQMIGGSSRTCLSNGIWSGSSPSCENIKCPWISLYNGLRGNFTKSNKLNSTVTFYCDRNAKLIGENSSICLSTGKWSNPKPTCEMLEIRCPVLDEKGIFSIYYDNGRRIGSFAQFYCRGDVLKVSGCSFMICQENGEWSGDYPTCVEYLNCKRFESSDVLQVIYGNGAKIGSMATFSCLPPYTLVGRDRARCREDGTWNHALPSCEAPKCSIDALTTSLPEGVFPQMSEGNENYVSQGTKLQFHCEDKLILTGSSNAVCGSNGRWEHEPVRCIKACVKIESTSPHLVIDPVKEHYIFGESVSFSCLDEMILNSKVERTMCLGADWSDPIPGCIRH